MTQETYYRKILIDRPSRSDAFQGKGHERTAKSLAMAISQFENADRSIGLDGPWGSGKSSIVEIAAAELDRSSASGSKKFIFFTFDIWKTQGTAFRRAFLEHFISWSIKNFPQKKSKLKKIEEKIRGKTRHVTTDNNTALDWYGILVLLALPFLPIFYFWAKNEYDRSTADAGGERAPTDAGVSNTSEVFEGGGEAFLTSWPMIVLYIFLAVTLIKSVGAYMFQGTPKKFSIWDTLSRTLLITAKQYEKQKSTQHIREVDPSDFEFQATLSEIISTVQGPKIRVVLVLDNIDRLPAEQMEEHWSAIRAIFSRGPEHSEQSKDGAITAIVPYDRSHVQSTSDTGSKDTGDTSTENTITKRELFSKTFDEILFVAPPVMSNARFFFEDRIAEALPNYQNSDELFKVYLIFTTYMRPPSGHFTPRQILSFINDLTNLFSIHQGKYPLTTVAVYTCHRERIAKNPLLLTNTDFLDGKLRRLAPDPEIEQNLAALLYNVESHIALEILLDERISNATTHAEPKELIALSKSQGFDLRVDDVVRAHAQEWIASGSFGTAIMNFNKLLAEYNGAARSQTIDSLVQFFDHVPELRPEKQDYLPFFSLLEFCPPDKFSSIIEKMIYKAIETVKSDSQGSPTYTSGRSVIDFIDKLKAYVSERMDSEVFIDILEKFELPPNPDFMFGAANRISESDYSLTDFGSVDFTLKGNEDKLREFVRDDYDLTEAAFGQLMDAGVVPLPQWVDTANSIVELLKDTDNASRDMFNGLLGTLAKIWTKLPASRRDEVELKVLGESAEFYVGLRKAYEAEQDLAGLGHAIFLMKHPRLEVDLPTTGEELRGSFTSEMKSSKQWFDELYKGTSEVEQVQIDFITEDARAVREVGSWLNAGRRGGDLLVERVVRTVLEHHSLPRFALTTFLQNFSYMGDVAGAGFGDVLQKYDRYINQEDVDRLELGDIPIGIASKTQEISGDGWKRVRQRIEDTLLLTEEDLWEGKFEDVDHDVLLLSEMSRTVGIHIDSVNFRDAFRRHVLKTLSGKSPEPKHHVDFDTILRAIPESFHNDIFRQCREKLSDVSHDGLKMAITLFPHTLEGIISSGDKISADEKDTVTRHLLCPALESGNEDVLSIFASIGRRKVDDFIKKSNQSTKDRVSGAMASFAKACDDRVLLQQISDLINGKRETRSLWEVWFPNLASKGEREDMDE